MTLTDQINHMSIKQMQERMSLCARMRDEMSQVVTDDTTEIEAACADLFALECTIREVMTARLVAS